MAAGSAGDGASLLTSTLDGVPVSSLQSPVYRYLLYEHNRRILPPICPQIISGLNQGQVAQKIYLREKLVA
jgi:hypothetical protein